MNLMNRELRDMSTQFRNSVVYSGEEGMERIKISRLIKLGVQVVHLLVGFGFAILAITEFIRNPPYFDVVGHNNDTTIPPRAFYNATRDDKGEIRRIMDLPILFLFLTYFVVLVWKKGWGVWSFLMTSSISIMLFLFLLVNYFASNVFDWRYFIPRSYGILVQVFSIALCWDCVVCTVFTRIDWFPFSFLPHKKPRNLLEKILVVLWNFFSILMFLFFCLLIWFSRLYYSWVCVRSISDVLLMCQFTDLVQCYPCDQADTCTHLDLCVNTAHSTFHCQTPLALLHGVNNALCIFNYNIGFFSFIMVFAYVGGTYFFLLGVLNFIARLLNIVIGKVISFMGKKTKTIIKRTVSMRKRSNSTDKDADDSSDEELLGSNEENHGLLSNATTRHSRNKPDLPEITDMNIVTS